MIFEIRDQSNFLQIRPLKLKFPDLQTDYGRNLISAVIQIKAGGFHGEYSAEIMTVDIEKFKQELIKLYKNLDGFALFDCLEQYLTIKISGDGLGHFTCDCRAIDSPGINQSELLFKLLFDQTQINELVSQLDLITREFPINGEFNFTNE